MSTNELYMAIFVMTLANFLTRVFPFLFFVKQEPPIWIVFIEKNFPPIIMTILIFYTLTSVDFTTKPYGMKEILAIVLTAFLHIRFNNYLVSIFIGTIFYMGLVQFV
jgi:branched-subunit amino acid transport protein AzlD